MSEQLARDPLEVSFKYPGAPSRPQPLLDPESMSYFLIDFGLSAYSILACFGILLRQKWGWFLTIPLHIIVFAVHLAASISLGQTIEQGLIGSFDGSAGRYASMVISLVSLYFLSRKDVRVFLAVSKN